MTAISSNCGLEMGGVIGLIDFIGRKVGRVDIGLQLRLEGCANTAESVKLNTTEELVGLDFICATTTKTIFRVAYQARNFSQLIFYT